MKTHNLKLSVDFCGAVLNGEKTFEVRKNDRGFQTGDLIRFIPTDGTSYRSSDGTVREHAKHEISGHTYNNKQWICSECKGLTETAYYCGHCYYNYCPNCGTRMDGVANG